SCTSPVPGGMSTISASSSPQTTSRRSWFRAEITIGPRQTTGAPSSIRKPIDITLTPKLSIGSSFWPSGARPGFAFMPNSLGMDGPNRSASRTPTLSPSLVRPTARLQAIVDLPTPPLPEATAMMCFTPGSGSLGRPCRRGGAPCAPCPGEATPRACSAVSVTTAAVTPGIARIAASAFSRIGSIALARAGSMAMAAKTLPSRIVTPETAPDSGREARPSGPGTAASAAITSSQETISICPTCLPARGGLAAIPKRGRSAPAEREPVAQGHDRAHDDDRGSAESGLARLRRQRRQHVHDHPLVGPGGVVDDRRRQVGVGAARDELAGQRLDVAQPHIDRNRLARLQERRPVELDSAVLPVPGHEDARLRVVAMGERNAG